MKTKKVDLAITFIWFKPGYVESSKVSWLIYEFNGSQFKVNREQAVLSLAEELYDKYMRDQEPYKNDCCLTVPETTKHCPECGQLMKFEFDSDHFLDWLCTLPEFDNDRYGYEGDSYWQTCPIPQRILRTPTSQHIFLSHYGELAILYALHLHPRVDWRGNFNLHGGCWNKEYLEKHWAILMQTGEWSLD